jgi:ectoine hydroxylase-related dioxygenase (phytanoyl-CoA dioxygenase family)
MTFRQANTGEWMVGQINVITALTDIGPGDGPTTLIPGSHKASMPHPALLTADGGHVTYRSDGPAGVARGKVEMHVEKGDVLMFTDTITHGSAARTNDGFRRMVLYRYSPRWIRSRFNYQPSPELWAQLDDDQKAIVDPIRPRHAPVDATA